MSDSNQPKPIAVTVQSAVRISGLSRSTVYDLMKDGALDSFTIGRRRLIRFTSLEALLGVQAVEHVGGV